MAWAIPLKTVYRYLNQLSPQVGIDVIYIEVDHLACQCNGEDGVPGSDPRAQLSRILGALD